MSDSVRAERGQHNITYRNGNFYLNKKAAEAAGFPRRIAVMRNTKTDEVRLYPADERDAKAFKLSAQGQASWGNAFTSYELARCIGLPLKGKTVRLFTTWDSEEKALCFRSRGASKDAA